MREGSERSLKGSPVQNVHERVFRAPLSAVGDLLDGLASPSDALWPRDRWPPVRFDRPLGVGAKGGHGPIRYTIEAYEPGRSIRFRFDAPRGFEGTHAFDVEEVAPGAVRLRHTLSMRARGWARLSWPLLFRPLHDALVEDALDRAEVSFQVPSAGPRQWPRRVRALRRAASYLR
ncbi:MAG: SRPBCC family protein [Acidobacteria bacterium]|nr:SRPBCC family protein [Acidobacteriota bacterium]